MAMTAAMTMSRKFHAFLIVIWVFLSGHHHTASALPPGFEDEEVVPINQVVDMAFVGNIMVAAAKGGKVYTFDVEDPNAEKQLAADMTDRVCTNGERGLGTVTVHPDFDRNRWVYFFYTYNRGNDDCAIDIQTGPVNRCSRFVMKEDWTLDLESELVLFQTPGQKDKIQNGGDMEFGSDGMLWVTTGDAGARSLKWAQLRNNLHGNIIRITDSGGIPLDNPFQGEGTARCNETGETEEGLICREIFAYGLRNPFRFSMDPHSTDKVRFLVSDVGQRTWEEINVGGTDYPGANYGWPQIEGPCEYNSVEDCSIGDSKSGLTDPLFWYQHNEEEEAAVLATVVPPPGLGWPAPYSDTNSFFFVDYIFGKFYHVTEAPKLACHSCVPPKHGFRNETFHEWPHPIALRFGPGPGSTRALYYTFRQGRIWVKRIVYKGGSNFAPTANIAASENQVLVGGMIAFDASETLDQNHPADELTYAWDFGDGSPVVTGMFATHQYNATGVYQVKLMAVDPEGARDETSLEVLVGEPPVVEILSPAEGTTFAVGDVFTLVGAGFDHFGHPLNETTQLFWEVRQHHANHYHPHLDIGTPGNNFTITGAPEPEDFFASGNSCLEILLTGTDSDGISATVSRNVMPKTVNLDFDSEPTGLKISLDEEILTMPQRVLSWEKHNLRVVVPPEQGDYKFVGWKIDYLIEDSRTVIPVPANSTVVPQYIALFELVETETPFDDPFETTTADADEDSIDPRNPPIDDDAVLFGAQSASTARSLSHLILLLSLFLLVRGSFDIP